MTKTIAVAGKGGTGKTTIAGLVVRYIVSKHLGSVLAIDADPSSNLNIVLGLPAAKSVGDVREEMLTQVSTGTMGQGISKQDYLEYKINEALVEGVGVDLLAMGRPEGPGCYCAANNMLRLITDRLAKEYDYVVIDNEAGLEHLSRRTTRDVDIMLVVSDPTIRGVVAAQRVIELVDELKTSVGKVYVVLNRVEDGLPQQLKDAVDKLNAELVGIIPRDATLADFDSTGRPLAELPEDSQAYKTVREIAEKIGV